MVKAFNAWGWRVPFIASILLTLAGVIVRMRIKSDLPHTPMPPGENLLSAVFLRHWWEISAIALANISTGIVTFVAFAFAVAWMVDVAGVSRQHALAINLYGLIAVGLLSLAGGAVGDRVGKLRVSMAGLAVLLSGAWPAFAAMGSQSTLMQITGISIIALGQGFFVGPLCACMVALAPAGVRTTVVSIGYSAPVGVFGGLAPLVTEYLFARLGLHMAPAIVIMAGALVSLTAIILMGRWPYRDPIPPEERQL
jgi:MHS family proline/betaine transporter-like MFS transporter